MSDLSKPVPPADSTAVWWEYQDGVLVGRTERRKRQVEVEVERRRPLKPILAGSEPQSNS